MSELLSREQLEARLRDVGRTRYHHLHPFHRSMMGGSLSKGQLQAWALNRYYYQSTIPMKDAAIIAKAEDAAFRRAWRRRLVDQDGEDGAAGGIDKWLALTDGLGLDRDYVISASGILPGTRFAADAYLNFVRQRSLLEAAASSLTELFSPTIIGERLSALLGRYDFIRPDMLSYFNDRPKQAAADSSFALAHVLTTARTPAQQAAAIAALEFKCSVLWSMLDALSYSYADPGHIPPGAFRPKADA